jgi:hypothetical protein
MPKIAHYNADENKQATDFRLWQRRKRVLVKVIGE